MVSQPQNPNSSQPRPLFGAELEARPPDGNPVFEMSGESAPSKDDNSTNNIYPGRKETGLNSQAHPWPFYLDEQGQRRPIMEEDGRPQAAANDDNDAVPAALAIKFAGRPAGSDASAEVRPLVMRPASPAETDSFIPAPLNISRPSQSSPPPLSPKKYKPYQPPTSLEEPKSPSIAGHPKHEPGQAYRPYRRPSYDERPSASVAAVPTAAPASGYGIGSAPTSPGLSAQPFRYPSPAGKEQQSLAAVPPAASPKIPAAGSPALGNRTPSPSLRPYQPPYSEYEVGNQVSQSPPPPVPLKTRPPAVDSSTQQEAGAHAGQQGSPPIPPKSSSPPQPAEIVLWPHPPASGPDKKTAQPPLANLPVSGSSPGPSKPTSPAPEQVASFIPDPTPIPVETKPPPVAAPTSQPSPQPSPQPAQESSAFIPQATYASSSAQNAEASARPSKFPQFPEVDQSIPSDPPPPYMPSATHGSGSHSVPSEKPSLFPPPPQIAPHLPQTDFPTQPTYASQSQPSSPLPPQSFSTPYGQPPSQPPPSLGKPPIQPPPGQPLSPQAPSSAQDDCLPPPGPPPSHTQYAYTPLPGQTYHVLQPPPPLPPRPSTAHAYPSVGLSTNPVNSMAYPPPPKTHYVAQPPAVAGPSHPPSSQRPAGGKLFGSTVAKKWLDKTSQVLENKVEEILQSHPDPRFRPQANSGHAPQQPQYASQQPSGQYYNNTSSATPQPQWQPPHSGPSS